METEEQKFWDGQYLTAEHSKQFLTAFTTIVLRKPDDKNPGIRVVPDLGHKTNNPSISFSIAKPGHPEPFITIAKVRVDDNDPTWEKWESVYERIKEVWPKGMLKMEKECWNGTRRLSQNQRSLLEHPGHFKGDWGFFEGVSVRLREVLLIFPESKFPSPSAVFEKNQNGDDTIQEDKEICRTQGASIFGRSWTIRPKGETMPFSAVVFSASQVILGHKWTDYAKECALMFPSTYATTWPTSTWTNYCCLGDKMLHIQFHVRYLSTWKSDIIRPNQEPEFSGLRLHRDHAEVVEHGVDSNLSIAETRSSIAILTSRWLQPPYFAMVTLTDSRDLSLDPVDPTDWTTMGLKPCKEFAGLVIFQLAIGLLIGEWGKQWTVTLDCIDGIAKTEIRNILDAHHRSRLMSGDQRTQEPYFTARQLLHRSKHVIEDLSESLSGLIDDVNSLLAGHAPNVILGNWETLRSYHRRIEDRLLKRIERKLVEVDDCLIMPVRIPAEHTLGGFISLSRESNALQAKGRRTPPPSQAHTTQVQTPPETPIAHRAQPNPRTYQELGSETSL